MRTARPRHRWLHMVSDSPPDADPHMAPAPIFAAPHVENRTGTTEKYVPWSTVGAKVHPYDFTAGRGRRGAASGDG